MFTALVLVCALDVVSAEQCYISISHMFYTSKEECVKNIIKTFDLGYWDVKREDGVDMNMVAYQCVEWTAGNNI